MTGRRSGIARRSHVHEQTIFTHRLPTVHRPACSVRQQSALRTPSQRAAAAVRANEAHQPAALRRCFCKRESRHSCQMPSRPVSGVQNRTLQPLRRWLPASGGGQVSRALPSGTQGQQW
jgi:hypothetical protein